MIRICFDIYDACGQWIARFALVFYIICYLLPTATSSVHHTRCLSPSCKKKFGLAFFAIVHAGVAGAVGDAGLSV